MIDDDSTHDGAAEQVRVQVWFLKPGGETFTEGGGPIGQQFGRMFKHLRLFRIDGENCLKIARIEGIKLALNYSSWVCKICHIRIDSTITEPWPSRDVNNEGELNKGCNKTGDG
jgi:hypothetical protein